MASKRVKVGSLLRAKDGGGVYFKANADFDLKKGETLNVATKKEQIASLEKAVAEGKLNPEKAAEILLFLMLLRPPVSTLVLYTVLF